MEEQEIMTLEQYLYYPYNPPKGKKVGPIGDKKAALMVKEKIEELADYLSVTPTTIRNFARGSYLPSKKKRGLIADYCMRPILWNNKGKYLVTHNQE